MNNATNTPVGELRFDDTDGKGGENLGKSNVLRMVDISNLDRYVDYKEDGIPVTRLKKGDSRPLFQLLVNAKGIGGAFYNTDNAPGSKVALSKIAISRPTKNSSTNSTLRFLDSAQKKSRLQM